MKNKPTHTRTHCALFPTRYSDPQTSKVMTCGFARPPLRAVTQIPRETRFVTRDGVVLCDSHEHASEMGSEN